jgi:hypothetical protein
MAERLAICDACDGVLANGSKCAYKDCKPCRRRAFLSNPGMACPDDPPRWMPFAPNARPSKVVWTISAYNEELLAQTVDELYRSAEDAPFDFEVLVVDDGSTDGCADDLPCRVIRNPRQYGIGYNLNVAADYAVREMGADVVGVADAHMKIPAGAIEAVATRAAQEICITSSASRGWEESSPFIGFGGYLVSTDRDRIAAKWMGARWPGNRPPVEWGRVEVPIGAFYAMSAKTIERLSGPTGRLWETVAGRWGFLLEPMAIKCRFLGVPVYVSRDHFTRHLYRKTNPVKGIHADKTRNVAFATAALFSREVWEKHCRRWCITRAGVTESEIDELAAAGAEGVKRPWNAEAEEEFLMSLPRLEGEKTESVPARRDKMIRGGRVTKKKTEFKEAVR